MILESGSPEILLVISVSALISPTLKIDDYLIYLSTKSHIDVHIYDRKIDPRDDYVQP